MHKATSIDEPELGGDRTVEEARLRSSKVMTIVENGEGQQLKLSYWLALTNILLDAERQVLTSLRQEMATNLQRPPPCASAPSIQTEIAQSEIH